MGGFASDANVIFMAFIAHPGSIAMHSYRLVATLTTAWLMKIPQVMIHYISTSTYGTQSACPPYLHLAVHVVMSP